jgi:pyruvate dehydrogenase E2 component (dihydrolipoamide acetyltransferase)
MAHPILMPKPGQMTEECVIVAWLKNEGDPVKKGDVLFEIETDKTNMDVESFDEGVLLKRYVVEGETVPVNTLCAYVGEIGEEVPEKAPEAVRSKAGPGSTPPASATGTAPAPAASQPGQPAEQMPTVAPVLRSEPSEGAGHLRISPRASRLAAASGIDPRTIRGTGPEGRITERDVQSALEARTQVVPSRVAAAPGQGSPVPEPAIRSSFRQVSYDTGAEEEGPRPLSRMRRIIAERLTLSATTVPQFTVTVAVDMTRLVALRTELKSAGTALTVTDFVVSAAAQSLVEFQAVNSRTDGASVWQRRRVHIGLAVSLPDGLVVPVIRDADHLSLTGLHARAAELAEAARSGALGPDDITGSTFTISNLGMFGVDEFCAIINPGESAILAVSSVIPTVIAVGDGFGIRQIMKLTMTADHRIVDGELAARFLNAIRRRLEDAPAFRGEMLNR